MASEFGISTRYDNEYIRAGSACFVASMRRFCGMEFDVYDVTEDRIRFVRDGRSVARDIGVFYITSEMLEPAEAVVVDRIPYEDFVSILIPRTGGDVNVSG